VSRLFDNISQTIGRTPVVRINHLAPEGVELFAKLEAFNPMGSIKDRIALAIIEDAEARGLLHPGQTVIEATSGNTGIALAMVCAQKGYPLVVVMAENFSVERRRLMRFLGARVVLTPASEKGSGMFRRARALAQRHGWFLCNQFASEANARIHFQTTAAEILEAFQGRRLDHVVLGAGTGGTVKGIAAALKARRPEIRIALCEPANSPLLRLHAENPTAAVGPDHSNPAFRPHPVQGVSPDFVPAFAADAMAAGHVDELIGVEGADALAMARELARREGIFCGISAGAAFSGAIDVSRRTAQGSSVLCLLPDTGERYQTTPLFDGIMTDMNDEEQDIAASVEMPAAAPATSAPAPVPSLMREQHTREEDSLEDLLKDPLEPVVMFGLQWCEFSWSLRKFLLSQGISFKMIELDSASFKTVADPALLRAALGKRSGSPTIPQLFVAGQVIGGCTDAFSSWKSGQLQRQLQDEGVSFLSEGPDPETFLPGWMAGRQKMRAA
jgi:cysteine synthase A